MQVLNGTGRGEISGIVRGMTYIWEDILRKTDSGEKRKVGNILQRVGNVKI